MRFFSAYTLAVALLALLALLVLGELSPAQEVDAEAPSDAVVEPEGFGTVRGVVVDADDENAPLPYALVEIVDADLQTTTASDGTFLIGNVPAGRRRLQVTRLGYNMSPAVVEVKTAQTVDVPPIPMTVDTGRTIIVTAPLVADVRAAQLEVRLSGQQLVKLSKQEMAQSVGAGDAAKQAEKLPGVSTVDSKYVYVRGLGGRYSQTLVNGGTIPSPEPDRREIPLDLFPTGLLESIAVVKTYSPDTPGEFAGGSVQIQTVDVPTEGFAKLSIGTAYRHGTSFKDFYSYKGGNLDRLSFDDGTRQLPGAVPKESVITAPPPRPPTPAQVQFIGRSFPNIWNIQTETAPFDGKLGLTFGERWGEESGPKLGLVGSINWANKYQTVLNETRRIVVNERRENPTPKIFSDFSVDRSTFEAELSGLLNLTYELNEGQKIGLRNMYTRSASDDALLQTGLDGQRGEDRPVEISRVKWVERSVLTTQAFGEHLMGWDTLLEWRAGYSLSQRDEPDNRQVRYIFDPNKEIFVIEPVAGSGTRKYYQLDENVYDGALDYSIPFRPFVEDKNPFKPDPQPEQKFKLGGSVLYRDRDFNARQFRFVESQGPPGAGGPVDEYGNPIDRSGSPEDIFQEKNINPDGYFLREESEPSNNYDATQSIFAGYGLFDVRLHEDWRMLLGARVEASRQEVDSPGLDEPVVLANTDVLPAANLIWEFYEDMQLRVGTSQTVSRPEFRELAPFQYQDVSAGWTAQGNPNLQRAKIWNIDFGWQWFLGRGDVLSANLFYKRFQNPIEMVNLPTASQLLTSWDNAESADLYGFEIEVRKNLGFLKELTKLDLSDFTVLANFSLMDSEVRIGDDPQFQQTNDKRPLQGQSPYLFNTGLLYDAKELGLSFSLSISTFGKRISAVGAAGLDDEYEQPRWSLNMGVSKKFGNSTVSLSAENLLDAIYEWKQNGITTQEYTKGWAVSLSYSYSF